MVPFLEPIGGTGDIVAGLVTAFAIQGQDLPTACRLAAQAARLAGQAADPDPATQVSGIIPFLGAASEHVLAADD